MATMLRITQNHSAPIPSLAGVDVELVAALHTISGTGDVKAQGRDARQSTVPLSEVLITLGSAGVFTAVYRTIYAYLAKSKSRSVSLECNGKKVTIRGHSIPEEKAIVEMLLPEFRESIKPARARSHTSHTDEI